MVCKNCGGDMNGDGYSVVRHCENLDLIGEGHEPDANPVYCTDSPLEGEIDIALPQQPEQSGLRAIHAMILNALDRDAAEGKAVRGEMAAELRAALSTKEK